MAAAADALQSRALEKMGPASSVKILARRERKQNEAVLGDESLLQETENKDRICVRKQLRSRETEDRDSIMSTRSVETKLRTAGAVRHTAPQSPTKSFSTTN